jgi:hypothetical protein
MSIVQIVPPTHVNKVWDKVEKFISAGLRRSGNEYTAEHLKVYVIKGQQSLLVAVDENNNIHGAATVEWNIFPNETIAFITSTGGKMLANKEVLSQVEDWARQNGATALRGACFESIARLWKAHGYERKYIIVEKKL